MTPKEKAKSLVGDFAFQIRCENDYFSDAKQCALICVDEIISIMIAFNGRELENNIDKINYWQQVKTEIENL